MLHAVQSPVIKLVVFGAAGQGYTLPFAAVERGLNRACRTSSLSAPETYLNWLAALSDESPDSRQLAGQFTMGDTSFFRDRACFQVLMRTVGRFPGNC